MTTKAFAYYRTSSATNVSKNNNGDESKKNGLREDKDSRARQEVAVRAYASASDIEIVDEFYDAAVSGADMIETRPGFEAMLKAILSNGVRADHPVNADAATPETRSHLNLEPSRPR